MYCVFTVCVVFCTYGQLRWPISAKHYMQTTMFNVLCFHCVCCVFTVCVVFSLCVLCFHRVCCVFTVYVVFSPCVLCFHCVRCVFTVCVVLSDEYVVLSDKCVVFCTYGPP
jgi:hypothetical protein